MTNATVKPPMWAVIGCLVCAGLAMAGAVYFGGHGELPMAMTGTALFVLLGGTGFELARRRSA